jgi:redox-sensing transcriptional repressor
MRGLSRATVARLPRYLRLLEDEENRSTVSSEDLAGAAGVNPANVRRDLSALDFPGTRGVGYAVAPLRDRIRRELGIESRRGVAIVGAGNLGTALARYFGLGKRGFDVVAIYDVDPGRIGESIGELTVDPLDHIREDCAAGRFEMAILSVPASAAQKVTDLLSDAGVSSILNFAPIRVTAPEKVAVRHVDLSMELQILSYYG